MFCIAYLRKLMCRIGKKKIVLIENIKSLGDWRASKKTRQTREKKNCLSTVSGLSNIHLTHIFE